MNLVQFFEGVRSCLAPNTTLSQRAGLPSGLLLDWAEQEAVVSETISPSCRGRVRFQGSWWFARCEERTVLAPGETVRVVGCQEITLVVQRCAGVEAGSNGLSVEMFPVAPELEIWVGNVHPTGRNSRVTINRLVP
ncbi:MAG TPA: NfeD family protein [Synechococcales cyanobacterium M55_K2018_004]|nr:NfeD family protein [Synechococcales cyanobacterium M55_K2018_004]